MPETKRLQLLPDAEINDLYARPAFNAKERELYFELDKKETAALNQYTNIRTRTYFILQLGYFKAKQQFFKFRFDEVTADVKFILDIYCDKIVSLHGCISRDYIKGQKETILKQFNYRNWSPTLVKQIESHLCELLRFYPHFHNAMRQLLVYFEQHEIVIPSYRVFQDMFSAAFAAETKRLTDIVSTMPEIFQIELNELIKNNNGITQLNLIRLDPKNFQCMTIREEVEKAESIADLYEFSDSFLPKLGLSKNAVRYYADITEHYPAARLRKLKKPQQWLYALCFVYHRYQQIMDNLITSFMYRVQMFQDAGKTAADIAYIEHQAKITLDFPGAAKFMKWFPNRDNRLNYEEMNKIAYDMLPEKQFLKLADYLEGLKFDKKDAQWKFYAEQSRSFALYLRPILLSIKFEYFQKDSNLMEMIDLLKNHYTDGKIPKQFKLADDMGFTIPKHMLPYLKTNPRDTHVAPHLFEFFVYKRMHYQIDKGRLFCNNSVSYCDLEHDLVPDSFVDQIETIAEKFGYAKLPIYCDERLDSALAALQKAWEITTGRICSGENSDIKIEESKYGNIKWQLLYDSSDELEERPIKNLPKTEISEVLMFIGNRVNIWASFTHRKTRYIKKRELEPIVAIAALLSQAFGIGEQKMSEMSDLSFNLLRYTSKDFLRIATLCDANDRVCNYTCSLPIYKEWNLLDDELLADADGQKFEALGTIQSRYSKKYIAKGRGISLYTLTANFIAVNAKNIGLNEYEGYSLFDMVFQNKTDVTIDAVTGDNHSLNKSNFVTLDVIDVAYLPGIKNIKEAAKYLYSVDSPDNYTGILQPKEQIKPERIKTQKRKLLRVFLSLIMQENTQTNIIRKLNAHNRYAKLRAALFEYNKIFKSTHILNLINDINLRKAILTARNRTESYHQLQQCIRKVYNGVFKGRKVVDNRVSAHVAKLIANSIIAYNATMLNAIYEKMMKNGAAQKTINEFLRISPIAWSYLLFTGRYSFKKNSWNINVKEMIKALESHLKQTVVST
jgi:TnpA family transposase